MVAKSPIINKLLITNVLIDSCVIGTKAKRFNSFALSYEKHTY